MRNALHVINNLHKENELVEVNKPNRDQRVGKYLQPKSE